MILTRRRQMEESQALQTTVKELAGQRKHRLMPRLANPRSDRMQNASTVQMELRVYFDSLIPHLSGHDEGPCRV
jgi:hypothetical protein